MKVLTKRKGVTIIELLVTIVIIAILALIAAVIYNSQVRSSRRTDAINTLFSIALAEESFRTTNTTYGTLSQVWNGSTSTGGYYNIAVSTVAATTYTITATATGDQVNDSQNGTSCSTLTYSMNAGTVTESPTACWPS